MRILPDQQDRQADYQRAHPAPVQPRSIFSGKGLFTTSDAGSASGLRSDWVAVQKDPEGDPAPTFNNNPGRLCWWMSRPTQEMADEANQRGVPFLGQAENQRELDTCLALHLTVPKALVGNPGSWDPDGFKAAATQGWFLANEWYWNKEPWLTKPDAGNYPLFVNTCFGIFPEAGATRKSLAEYLAAWSGPYSVWAAEHMDADDREVYNAS